MCVTCVLVCVCSCVCVLVCVFLCVFICMTVQSVPRLSLQEELEAGVVINLAVPSQRRSCCVRATDSRDRSAAFGSVTLSHISACYGDVVAVLDATISAPMGSLSRHAAAAMVAFRSPFYQKSIAEYWREKGFHYSEADARRVRVVKVMVSGTELDYPADKVFRLFARPVVIDAGAAGAGAGAGSSAVVLPARTHNHDFPWTESPSIRLRNVIVASPDWVLLGADYSQV